MSSSDSLRWFVPGRIEVLGKHTDYAGGRSLLCATSRGIAVEAAPRADAVLRIDDVRRGLTTQFEIGPDLQADAGDWTTYPRTVARRVARNFPGASRGADITIDSDLPRAAGLSSSSALIVGFFTALAAVNDLHARPEYSENIHGVADLAEYLGCCENGQTFRGLHGDRGVGTLGGSQDHAAIVCSRAGFVEQYGFAPVRHERSIALAGEWRFAVGVSGVRASKTGGARHRYNFASRAASAALQAWRAASGREDATLFAAATWSPEARAAVDEALASVPVEEFSAAALRARFEQFASEALDFVPAAGDALARSDFASFGEVVDRSQDAAERLLGNQVSETIALARLAREHGAAAASAFGAGFGGSVWALVSSAASEEFVLRWSAAYRHAFPQHAPRCEFFTTRPSDGVRVVA